MKTFKPSALTIALMMGGVQIAAMSNIAYAAEETPKEAQKQQQKAEKSDVEVIEVSGFRGSIIKSLNTKRFSDTVVDAISADDIGGLPDVSIADSLTRLPGVTSVRIDGQSSELNVRGLSGGFVFSTLNGREMVSTSGGRSIQFDMFPAELISGAQVYKSQKASLIEGGIAATINLETANALDNEEDHSFRASLHGNYNEAAADNEDSDTFGRRLTLSYQGKYFDETVGIAVGWANMFQPTVSSRFVNYQFDEQDLSAAYDGAPESILVSSGFEINERGGEDERNAFTLALNWEPRDDLRFQFDAFHSKFDSNKWDRGLRISGINNIATPGAGLLIDNPLYADGALVGGTIYRDPDGTLLAPPYPGSSRDINIQTQADDNTTNSSSSAFGLRADWDITDDLMMTVDVSHSEGDEEYKDQVLRMAYFEDSSAATPIIDDNIIFSYQLNGLNNPDLQFNQDFTDTAHMMVTSSESYPHIESNTSDALRVDFAYQLESNIFSSLEFGVRASMRDYNLSRGRFLYGTTDGNMRNGQYITFGEDADGNLIEVERFQPHVLNSSNSTVSAIGGDLSGMPSFLSVDNDDILNAWIPGVDRTPVRTWEHDWTMTQGNLVEEDVLSAYLQVNIDTEFFGLPVTGNFGARYVDTTQSSTGLVNVGAGNGDIIYDDVGGTNSDWEHKKISESYNDFLPSLNLNFKVTDDDQIRFAYSKVMSRPEMPTMANSGNWKFDVNRDGDGRNYIGLDSSTSPKLRPFYANQYDVSFEHYFTETEGAFVLALWYKDVANIVSDSTEVDYDFAANGFDLPSIPDNKVEDESGNILVWEDGDYSHAENNGDAGYIRGIEIGYTQTFSFLPGYFSGLGANVNFSYTESEIEVESSVPGEENQLGPIEGLSPRVLSATLFYDWDDKLSARVSGRYRSDYLSRQVAIGSNQSAYFQEETIISAQVSYNFTENLQAVISADNITDEPNISYFGNTSRTGTIQYFGRTIYFGVNYTM
ncbi:TonB-dependent receptor [Colwellia piezophila]|uniref:TonB-dependent receptor n=1 Tax=Colwellia piezophila TaxID=211668 RepID=UPI00035D7747|nr:TonB-dependent receptor [Colwellia piezophila]